MTTEAANSSRKWVSLSVRKGTEIQVDRLRSAYMKLHGAFISDDEVVAALINGKTAKDLPAPLKKDMGGK